MIIFVVAFSVWVVKKYFEVQLYSIFNLDDNVFIVRPANRDWACQTERCHTLSNKTSLQ